MTSLVNACERGDLAAVEQQLLGNADVNAKDDKLRTGLHFACQQGNHKIVQLLLKHGADVNALDQDWRTPLMLASLLPKPIMDTFRLLVAAKPQLELRDKSGQTLLWYALRPTHREILQLLLENGVDAAAVKTSTGETPLIRLAATESKDRLSGAMQTAQLLIAKGNINSVDKNGLSALMAACSNDWKHPLVKLLLENGADVDLLMPSMENNDFKESAMTLATKSNSRESIKLLLQAGVDPSCKVDAYSAMQIKGMGLISLAATTGDDATVRLLAKAGCDVDAYDRTIKHLDSPLMFAVCFGNRSMVETLIQFGANKQVKTRDGLSLFEHCELVQQKEVLQLIAPQTGNNRIKLEKPERLTEQDLKMGFTFAFCAQCRCGGKQQEDLMVCGGCQMVAYCNAECQAKHWKQHKKACKQKQAVNVKALSTENCK